MSAISSRSISSAPSEAALSETISRLIRTSKEKKICSSLEVLSKKVETFHSEFARKQITFEDLYFFCYSVFFDRTSFLNLMSSYEDLGGILFKKVKEKLKLDLDHLKKLNFTQDPKAQILKRELLIYEKVFSQITTEILPCQIDVIEASLKDSPFFSSIKGPLKTKLDNALAHLVTFSCNLDERVKQILTVDELRKKCRRCEKKIEKKQDLELNHKLIALFKKTLEEIQDGPIRLLDFSLFMTPAHKLAEELDRNESFSEETFLAQVLLIIYIYKTKTSFERVHLVDQIKGFEFLLYFFNEIIGKENVHFGDPFLESRCLHMRSSLLLKDTLVCSKIFPESFMQYSPLISPLSPKNFFRLISFQECFGDLFDSSEVQMKEEKLKELYKQLLAFKEDELNLTQKTIGIIDSILLEIDQIKSREGVDLQMHIEKINALFSLAQKSSHIVILDPFEHLASRIKKLSI